MRYHPIHLLAAIILAAAHFPCSVAEAAEAPAQFTPLIGVRPKIVASSVAYPGGNYEVGNMIDGNVRTEHSSASKGTETFIDFDFGREVPVAGLCHVDRNDPATVAGSRSPIRR